jgi:hypothetical protein
MKRSDAFGLPRDAGERTKAAQRGIDEATDVAIGIVAEAFC